MDPASWKFSGCSMKKHNLVGWCHMVPDVTEVSEQAFFASHFHEQPRKPRRPRPKNLDESLGFIRGIHHSRWSWTNFFTISTGLGHFWVFCTDIPPVYMLKPILLCCKRPSFVCRTVRPSFLLVIYFIYLFFFGGWSSHLLGRRNLSFAS